MSVLARAKLRCDAFWLDGVWYAPPEVGEGTCEAVTYLDPVLDLSRETWHEELGAVSVELGWTVVPSADGTDGYLVLCPDHDPVRYNVTVDERWVL